MTILSSCTSDVVYLTLPISDIYAMKMEALYASNAAFKGPVLRDDGSYRT